LEIQLEPAAASVKKLAAEMLWVMFLCSSNIKPETKRDGIRKIWQWSEEKFPETSPWLQDDVLVGVGSSGTGYNTNRWRELVYFIRLMIVFKGLSAADREALLKDGWTMNKWLETIEENESRQFRHMFLFILFPDLFERIFGGVDRKMVVRWVLDIPQARVNKLSAFEIDEKLANIRRDQEESYKTKELDFYLSPMQELWGKTPNSWLFTWNPDNFPWESLNSDRDTTHGGKTVTHRWSCSNRNAKVGDKAYLTRTGKDPKGIIAIGNVITSPYEQPHWDEIKADNGKTRWYVDIVFFRIQNPFQKDLIITDDDLKTIALDSQKWAPQGSGIEIKTRSAGLLQKLWDEKIGGKPLSTKVSKIPGIAEATNLIMYGPPGTGKTYELNRKIEQYRSKRLYMDREPWLVQQLTEVRWFDVVAATLYALGGRAKVAEIKDHEFMRLKAKAMGRTKTISPTIWGTLQQHASEASQTVKTQKRSAPFVFDKTDESVWFFTPDLQEECADLIELADSWMAGPGKEIDQRRYEFVTFHQAYSYEDFVEGIRPVQDRENGELAYQVVPGVFRRIAVKAKADPDQRYAIFIDEINRGNIAKIFGELITLVEPDKRAVYDREQLVSGMEVTLPYSGDRFGVPKNLDVYGAMNTADRSIALLDTALRRRFRFKELMPEPGLISGSRGDGYIEDDEGGRIDLRALLEAMNSRIRFLLNRDMMLGHAYFYEVRDFMGLKGVMLNQIIPLLQEYFYDDWRRIQLVFRDIGLGGKELEPQIICSCTLNKKAVLGFDSEDHEDMVDYHVANAEDITPDAVRKIYEEND
jgi:hypothetical protein